MGRFAKMLGEGAFTPEQQRFLEAHYPPLKQQVTSSGAAGLLGRCEDGCPAEVHNLCEELAKDGRLPISTLSQRRLCMESIGNISMGVPEVLAAARDYGYVHPYLPPPLGLQWRCVRPNYWKLGLVGG